MQVLAAGFIVVRSLGGRRWSYSMRSVVRGLWLASRTIPSRVSYNQHKAFSSCFTSMWLVIVRHVGVAFPSSKSAATLAWCFGSVSV